ncbi:MAG: sigma-70 family RNA polymerase sigma factor [Bacteroidales bacterium]|nr:sigma-70 family RNA polymerase sigma factor [Bacteroidales bacterium]
MNSNGKDFILTDYAQKLIQFKARQIGRRPGFGESDQDDLQQELWLMVCERAGAFDPSKASLNTFIDRIVNNSVADLVRSRERLKRGVCGPVVTLDGDGTDKSWSKPLGSGISPAHLYRRIGIAPRADTEVREIVEAVRTVLKSLPSDLREICERLIEGTVHSVAGEMNVSRRAVRNACRAIQAILEKAGIENA